MEYEKFCEECGEYFTTTRKGLKICHSCSLERAARANKNAYEKQKCSSITENPRKTFNGILEEIAEYNKKHSCCLSYGQYMAMRTLEVEKRRKVKKG